MVQFYCVTTDLITDKYKLLAMRVNSQLNKPLRLENYIRSIQTTSSNWNVYVRLHNGNGCCLEVEPSDKLCDVIQRKEMKELGLPLPFKAIFQTQEISNFDKTLEEAGLKN